MSAAVKVQTAPTLTLVKTLITALKKRNPMETKFKNFINQKDQGPHPITYFLCYDLDENVYRIVSEYDITFNCIVLQKAFVPSKHDKKSEKTIIDYEYLGEKK